MSGTGSRLRRPAAGGGAIAGDPARHAAILVSLCTPPPTDRYPDRPAVGRRPFSPTALRPRAGRKRTPRDERLDDPLRGTRVQRLNVLRSRYSFHPLGFVLGNHLGYRHVARAAARRGERSRTRIDPPLSRYRRRRTGTARNPRHERARDGVRTPRLQDLRSSK